MLLEQEVVNNANSLFNVAILLTPFMGAVFARLLKKVLHIDSADQVPASIAAMSKLPIRHFLSDTVSDISVEGAQANYKLRTSKTPGKKDVTGELVIVPPASQEGSGTLLIMREGPHQFVEGTVKISINASHGPDRPLPLGEKHKGPQGTEEKGINILGIVFYRKGQ